MPPKKKINTEKNIFGDLPFPIQGERPLLGGFLSVPKLEKRSSFIKTDQYSDNSVENIINNSFEEIKKNVGVIINFAIKKYGNNFSVIKIEHGTGTIIEWPEKDNFSILTARHCITNKELQDAFSAGYVLNVFFPYNDTIKKSFTKDIELFVEEMSHIINQESSKEKDDWGEPKKTLKGDEVFKGKQFPSTKNNFIKKFKEGSSFRDNCLKIFPDNQEREILDFLDRAGSKSDLNPLLIVESFFPNARGLGSDEFTYHGREIIIKEKKTKKDEKISSKRSEKKYFREIDINDIAICKFKAKTNRGNWNISKQIKLTSFLDPESFQSFNSLWNPDRIMYGYPIVGGTEIKGVFSKNDVEKEIEIENSIDIKIAHDGLVEDIHNYNIFSFFNSSNAKGASGSAVFLFPEESNVLKSEIFILGVFSTIEDKGSPYYHLGYAEYIAPFLKGTVFFQKGEYEEFLLETNVGIDEKWNSSFGEKIKDEGLAFSSRKMKEKDKTLKKKEDEWGEWNDSAWYQNSASGKGNTKKEDKEDEWGQEFSKNWSWK